jgi:hypothetical protein
MSKSNNHASAGVGKEGVVLIHNLIDKARFYKKRGDQYFDQNNHLQAISDYNRAIQQGRVYSAASYARAAAFAKLKNYPFAQQDLARFAQIKAATDPQKVADKIISFYQKYLTHLPEETALEIINPALLYLPKEKREAIIAALGPTENLSWLFEEPKQSLSSAENIPQPRVEPVQSVADTSEQTALDILTATTFKNRNQDNKSQVQENPAYPQQQALLDYNHTQHGRVYSAAPDYYTAFDKLRNSVAQRHFTWLAPIDQLPAANINLYQPYPTHLPEETALQHINPLQLHLPRKQQKPIMTIIIPAASIQTFCDILTTTTLKNRNLNQSQAEENADYAQNVASLTILDRLETETAPSTLPEIETLISLSAEPGTDSQISETEETTPPAPQLISPVAEQVEEPQKNSSRRNSISASAAEPNEDSLNTNPLLSIMTASVRRDSDASIADWTLTSEQDANYPEFDEEVEELNPADSASSNAAQNSSQPPAEPPSQYTDISAGSRAEQSSSSSSSWTERVMNFARWGASMVKR